ncbi:MAG: hypothetical protein HY875_12065 [Chloroflexi bacterium]|nr:hypothetical protein [Chloroflexota bacterium]
MPSFEWNARFWRDFQRLTPAQQAEFLRVVQQFVDDLRTGTHRPGHRLKGVSGHPRVFEITWDPDGRAIFERGREKRPGDPHVIWRRIGSHDIFRDP